MKSLARDGEREPYTTGRAGAAGAACAAGKTVVEAMTGQ
jgi:hypothetical protein